MDQRRSHSHRESSRRDSSHSHSRRDDRHRSRDEERRSSHSSSHSRHSSHSKEDSHKRKRSQGSQEPAVPKEFPKNDEYEKRVSEQLVTLERSEEDVEKLMEERRLKRQAILAKYQKVEEVVSSDEKRRETETRVELVENSLELVDGEVLVKSEVVAVVGESPSSPETKMEGEASKMEAEEDGFDMFGDTPVEDAPRKLRQRSPTAGIPRDTDIEADSEGYCELPVGTVLNGRYSIMCRLGTGMFSKVFKAKDLQTNAEIAIKVLRNNEMMKRVGLKEVEFLELVAKADPEDKFSCARLITHFEDRDFLCLVFELEGDDLLEVIKKHGRGMGLSLKAVQVYGKQLFLSLFHLKRVGLLHSDLKPTNILVNPARTRIRLSDLGSAHTLREVEVAPFLVTGWFRPPEVILGLKYGHPIDMWAACCTIFEMTTGKTLFKGCSNNDMLRMHLAVKGRDSLSKKLLRKGQFSGEYFDENLNFLEKRVDPITGRIYTHPVTINEPTRDIKSELLEGQQEEDVPKVLQLHDLLQKGLTLDPAKRLTVEEALVHPFFS